MSNINNAIITAQTFFPFTVKEKTSWIWKIIPSNYTTMLFHTLYFPEGQLTASPNSSLMVLGHELTHLHDESKGQFVFSTSYLFPQILAPLAGILLIWHWWMALIVGLVMLLPFPAPFRSQIEQRGYTASLYMLSKLIKDGKVPASNWDKEVAYSASQFHVWVYYFMGWWFKGTNNYFAGLTMENVGQALEADLITKLDQIYAAY